jgi:3-hydroxyisobutyrate dehydrogenase
MIAYLGTGLLGTNFVKALLKQGETVQVWNRTASKAQSLEAFGATAFEEVELAVKNAARIHLTLSDDDAVDEILEKASAGFAQGVHIIDHTTTSAAGALKRTLYWKKRGYDYLHVPVFMGPQNALDGTGLMLVSGDSTLISTLQPVLLKMTGKVLNVGEEPGRAAAIKLMGNAFLLFITAGLSDTLALGKSMDIPSSDLVTLFNEWNPGAFLPARLQRLLAADYDNPSWELNMARKDTRLMMEAAAGAETQLATIPAIAAEMDRWINKGQAHKDWTILAKDNL